MDRYGKRVSRIVLSLVLVLTLVFGSVGFDGAQALTKVTTTNIRVAGADRYGTAFAVADRLYKTNGAFDAVIVAYGGNYPDALSGSYLAKVKKAPILLVNSRTEGEVLTYIKSHMKSTGTVYILGGEMAVGKILDSNLKKSKIKYKRLGGLTRYDTNLLILSEAGKTDNRVLICSGKNYPDAISASAVGAPILLVGNALTADQIQYLKNMQPDKIYIIGGTDAVSSTVFNTAKTVAKTVRVGGINRYETSSLVAETFFSGKTKVTLARGDLFPDALTGATLSMSIGGPMILVGNQYNTGYVNSFISKNKVKTCYVLGGTSALSNDILSLATTTYSGYNGDIGVDGRKGTAEAVLNVMRSWIGYSVANGKHREIIDIYNSVLPHPVGFKMPYTEAWCDACVTAAAIKAGCSDLVGRECGVERHVKIFKKMGIWIEDGTIRPKPGDIIVFNWSKSTQPNDLPGHHIGFVEKVEGNTIVTIEGNYKDSVRRRYISVGWGYIRGYARPKYPKS